ncbi:hypothetical protein DITRI_Ditri02bG0200600 [Diplodiscus trichospermus]
MATTSPPPKSSPPAVAPASATNPPPLPPSTSTSSPPPTQNSPPLGPSTHVSPPTNANPPASQSPPPPDVNPVTSSPPSPAQTSPPPVLAPTSPPPPRAVSPSSPPSSSTSPPPAPVPPPSPPSPAPRPSPGPPQNSSPPPQIPSAQPPDTSPPPINSSSPPPSQSPPTVTPSSPPPSAMSPIPTPPPPMSTPPSSQPTPSPSNSSSRSSPPPPIIRLSPPPPQDLTPPSDNPTVNASGPRAAESSDSGGIGVGGSVAIGIAVGIIVLSLIGLAVWCLRKQKKKKLSRLNGRYVMPSPLGSSARSDSTKTHSSAPLVGSSSGSYFVHSPPEMPEPGALGNSKSCFTYEELAKATNGFSDQNLLGEGGFGAVYKGCLLDGREVAVKQLKIGGGQGEREFEAEVGIISRIHHRHLVSLVGYCISENKRLLIYDYVPNNTLDFHLHGEYRPVLDWATRVKIAAGAARGIAYLHEDCHPRIIHRDIKSSNILLDNNFEARVSDFGLAKLVLDANTHVTTRVMGTFGYMAPEYASSGKLSEKSDVFSFGVVLLELITGRKPVDASQPLGDESLVEWARPLLSHVLDSNDFDSLADPKLGRNYVESEMFWMIEAAGACVRHSAAKRPQMGQVVRAFDSLATSDLSNGMRVGESEAFNAAQQSEEIRWFRRMAFGSQNYSTGYFSENSSS